MCRLLFLRLVTVSIVLSLITACGDGAGPTAASTSTMSAGGSGGNGDGPTDSSAGRDGSSQKPNMACAKDDDCEDGQICEQDDPQAPGQCIDAPNGGASAMMMMINNPEGGRIING